MLPQKTANARLRVKKRVSEGKYTLKPGYDYVPLKDVFEELKMPNYYEKAVNLNPAKRRIHLLNVPDGTWENSDFWNDINKPLMDDIINNPNNYNVIIMAPPESAPQLGGSFSKEINKLVSNDYNFVNKNGYWKLKK